MSETHDSSEVEPSVNLQEAEPIPKRFWWLKRLLIAAGLLVVALACLRWWWGFEAHRRLQAQIEQYRQAGQPVYASEFDAELDAVPDEENAAILYEQAISAITFTTVSGVRYEEFLAERTTFDENMEAATELIKSNAAVLDLIRQARAKPRVAWSQRLTGWPGKRNSGLMSGQRNLAKLIRFSACYHYRTGNHAEAIETMHDQFAFGEAVASHPTLIASVMAWACYGWGFSSLEESVVRLHVDTTKPDRESRIRSANRAQIEELLASLLEEVRTRRAVIRSCYGDRAGSLDLLGSVRKFGAGALVGNVSQPRPLWTRVTDFVGTPLLVLDTVRMVKLHTLAAEAAAETSWPEAAKHFPPMTESRCLLRSVTRPLTLTIFGGAYEGERTVIQAHFTHLARRRMAATALAIRLYVLDNRRRPERFAQLVPDYIPAVPLDPFSAEPTPIRYKPDAQRPILYSVGRNGTDNGGVWTRRPDGRIDRDKSDIVYYLDGKHVEEDDADPEGSNEAGQDDKDGKDEERQGDEDQSGQSEPK